MRTRQSTSFWTPQVIRDTPATRHLCAGAYVDQGFRDMVIRKVYNEPRQRVAPSYGFDLVAVVAHARRAWALETAYQASVLAVFVTGMATNPAGTILAVCVLLFLPLAAKALRTAPQVLQLKGKSLWSRLLRGSTAVGADELRERKRMLVLCGAGCAGLVLVPVVVAGRLATPMSAAVLAASAMLLMVTVFSLATAAIRQWSVNCLRRAESLRPSSLTARMKVIDLQQSHSLVIYAHKPQDGGDPSPFFGSGRPRLRWPAETIRLLRESSGDETPQEYDAPPFKMSELIDFVRTEIAKMGDPLDSVALPGFYIRQRLFTDERDALAVQEFLDTEPDLAAIDRIINDPYGPTHHYLEIGATKTGDVVTTIFARFTIIAGALVLEIAMGALTSTPDQFLVVDAYKENGPGAIARAAVRGLSTLSRDAGKVWRLAEVPVFLTRAIWARKDRTTVLRRRFVIGTKLSVRERAAIPWSQREAALIRPEVLRHKELILRRLLDVTVSFLETKEVDVSDFKKQMNTIINNHGDMTFNDTAIGNNARINNQNTAEGGDTGGPDK